MMNESEMARIVEALKRLSEKSQTEGHRVCRIAIVFESECGTQGRVFLEAEHKDPHRLRGLLLDLLENGARPS